MSNSFQPPGATSWTRSLCSRCCGPSTRTGASYRWVGMWGTPTRTRSHASLSCTCSLRRLVPFIATDQWASVFAGCRGPPCSDRIPVAAGGVQGGRRQHAVGAAAQGAVTGAAGCGQWAAACQLPTEGASAGALQGLFACLPAVCRVPLRPAFCDPTVQYLCIYITNLTGGEHDHRCLWWAHDAGAPGPRGSRALDGGEAGAGGRNHIVCSTAQLLCETWQLAGAANEHTFTNTVLSDEQFNRHNCDSHLNPHHPPTPVFAQAAVAAAARAPHRLRAVR